MESKRALPLRAFSPSSAAGSRAKIAENVAKGLHPTAESAYEFAVKLD